MWKALPDLRGGVRTVVPEGIDVLFKLTHGEEGAVASEVPLVIDDRPAEPLLRRRRDGKDVVGIVDGRQCRTGRQVAAVVRISEDELARLRQSRSAHAA